MLYRNLFIIFCIIYLTGPALAQFSDNFSSELEELADHWQGDRSLFEIENNRLRLAAPAAQGRAWLGVQHHSLHDAEWSLGIEMKFNPSSQNYADIWLMADRPLSSEQICGYFVRVGDTRDDLRLYRRDGTEEHIELLIDGPDGMTDFSTVTLRIRVTRDATGHWSIRAANGKEGGLMELGTARDERYRYGPWFMLACRYTATRSDKFYFDDIAVQGTPLVDSIPPSLISVTALSRSRLQLTFSEPIEIASLETQGIRAGSRKSVSVSKHPDTSVIEVDFGNAFFEDGGFYPISISGLCDHFGNCTEIRDHPFNFDGSHLLRYREVVINEIMADPHPPVGLPNAEYVELFNPSPRSINLGGWKLAGAGSDLFPEFHLEPGAFVLLCSEGNVDLFAEPCLSWGRSGNLLNTGEWLHLISGDGEVVDSLEYRVSWYGDSAKKNGGWSLEQINPHQVCSDATNWTASVDSSGGSPGAINSVYDPAANPDPAQVVSLRPADSLHIAVVFDKALDPRSLADIELYLPGIDVREVIFTSADRLLIACASKLENGKKYFIRLSGLRDCAGNGMDKAEQYFKADFNPPVLLSVAALHAHALRLIFSKALEPAEARKAGNYRIEEISASASQVSLQRDSLIVLQFAQALPAGGTLSIKCAGLSDLNGNALSGDIFQFHCRWTEGPAFGELIITEMMVDPNPPVGLPDHEYIELYNASDRVFRSDRISLRVGSRQRNIDFLEIEPGQHIVLCAQRALPEFQRLGTAYALSAWYALRNGGDTLALYSDQGALVFGLAYDLDWYQSNRKQNGGWSLEMMDNAQPCRGKPNWQASIDPSGGSPGRANSHRVRMPDLTGPRVHRAWTEGDSILTVEFDETLHPGSILRMGLIINPALPISQAIIEEPLCTTLRIRLAEPLKSGTKYCIEISGITDCTGNPVDRRFNSTCFFLSEPPSYGDVVINEILPEPRNNGVEFVELYNQSAKYIDLRGCALSYRGSGQAYSAYAIANTSRIIEPGDYLALCTDPIMLHADFPAGNRDKYHKAENMPALNNDLGSLVLIDHAGQAVDSAMYDQNHHHPLIRNRAGVSLERISPRRPGHEPENWHSASSMSGFATPGLPNSASHHSEVSGPCIRIDPPVFAPDQPGPLSYTTIYYEFSRPGLMASVTVTDSRGRPVRSLVKNQTLSVSGEIMWDGYNDRGELLGVGYYIVYFHVFHPDGSERLFRERIALAAHFH